MAVGWAASEVTLRPSLLRAYHLTSYHAAGQAVRIGCHPPGSLLAHLRSRHAVFITAWNPLSRRMPRGWNDRAQRRLELHLRRFRSLNGHGSLGTWHEAHLLVAGHPGAISRIARRFRQSAIVVLQQGRKARLMLLQP